MPHSFWFDGSAYILFTVRKSGKTWLFIAFSRIRGIVHVYWFRNEWNKPGWMKIFTLYPTFNFHIWKRLCAVHKAPHPTLSFGYFSKPGSGWAPRLRYAFTFSPHRNGSFLLTIPHSIISAADPVTNAVANDVPVTLAYPPPGTGAVILTPGATRSGFG